MHSEHRKKNWLAGAIKHPGALRQQLDIPKGKKIPVAKLKSAAKSSDSTLAKRARLALTMRGFGK